MDLRNNNQFQINYIDYWILLGLRSEPRGWGREGFKISRSTRTPFGSKANIQHGCRVPLECPPLAATHMITMHTSGMDLQNKRSCKPKYWCGCTLYMVRTFSLRFPPLLSPLPGVHHFRPCSPCKNCQGAGGRSGEKHVAWSKSRRTSKGQGRLGCLELGMRCMDTWGS